jgi:outer membrane protein OmpA-like peptidoglycan-associated protein
MIMNILRKAAAVLFVGLLTTTLYADSLPFKSMPKFTQFENKFEPYHPMELRLEKQTKVLFGNYWHQKFKHPTAYNKKQFFKTLASLNPNAKLVAERRNTRWYKFSKGKDIYGIKVVFNGKWYVAEAVLPKPYKPILKLGGSAPLNYSENARQKLPTHIVLPQINGFHILRSEYKQYNQLDLRYRDPLQGKKTKLTVEGKFWKVTYQQIKKDGFNHRYLLAQNMADELKRIGGSILEHNKHTVVFSIDLAQGQVVGKVEAFTASIKITFIEKEAFKQTLTINPDELKTELDKSGKVTLKGIYFDTGKSVLKPQSKSAIDAVATLMKKYPDMKICVQGHTDSVGSDDSNLQLSKARAASVTQAIIRAGIPTANLTSKGYGETHPVAPNDTPEGRAKNRRVELHRVSGGSRQAVITIDFIKPMPQSVLIAKRTYKHRKFPFKVKDASGKFVTQKFIGIQTTREYEFQDQTGKRIKSVSRLEVIKNYRNVLRQLGATDIYENNHSIYFQFKDRGDGAQVMGLIEAYTGNYYVTFYGVQKNEVGYKSNTQMQKTVDEKTGQLPQNIVGKWVFDKQRTLQTIDGNYSYNLGGRHMAFEINANGSFSMVAQNEGTHTGRVLQKSKGQYVLKLDEERQFDLFMDKDAFTLKIPVSANIIMKPIFARPENVHPYVLDIAPLQFNRQYRTVEPMDGKHTYIKFLKNGQYLFSEQPFSQKISPKKTNIEIIRKKGKLFLTIGDGVPVIPTKDGFELHNQGFSIAYAPFE